MKSLYDNCYDYDYTRPKAVVFPAPPPTTNALSLTERARLLRSSKKIARVLGATPRFVDSEVEDVGGNDDMLVLSPQSLYLSPQSLYRTSVDTVDSISACSTSVTSTSYTSTSTSPTSVSSLYCVDNARKPLSLTPYEDARPTRKPLALRPALETSLESIPASFSTSTLTTLPAIRTLATHPKRSAPLDGSSSSSSCRGMSPEPDSSPSFVIPNRAAARRRKLDRLRRTLGEDVPVRLIFSQTAESDSDSGSEPSLSSCGKTSSEDDLITPDSSPLSPTRPLFNNVDIAKHESKPISCSFERSPRKKKIMNTRDSLTLPLKPLRATRAIKMPQTSRLPPLAPSDSPNKQASPKATPQHKPPAPSKTSGSKPTNQLRIYEHPPIVHRCSHSGSSMSARLGLGIILEEKGESEWYGSDDEDDDRFIKDDEVLGAVCERGGVNLFLYRGPVGKGMGRGLTKSYGNSGH
ncbi:hypothetical protein C0995_012695 [Termitomyces sp. Mi166|nr:hypothetical protein C0995_012695 [Termitomyces sp. Mi166\